MRDNEVSVLPKKITCYANDVSSVKKLVEQFEDRMDGDELLTLMDVMAIHGSLTREKKSAFITEFTESSFSDVNFNVLCSTSGVANVGIDSKNVRAVFRLDLPPSIHDLT